MRRWMPQCRLPAVATEFRDCIVITYPQPIVFRYNLGMKTGKNKKFIATFQHKNLNVNSFTLSTVTNICSS